MKNTFARNKDPSTRGQKRRRRRRRRRKKTPHTHVHIQTCPGPCGQLLRSTVSFCFLLIPLRKYPELHCLRVNQSENMFVLRSRIFQVLIFLVLGYSKCLYLPPCNQLLTLTFRRFLLCREKEIAGYCVRKYTE